MQREIDRKILRQIKIVAFDMLMMGAVIAISSVLIFILWPKKVPQAVIERYMLENHLQIISQEWTFRGCLGTNAVYRTYFTAVDYNGTQKKGNICCSLGLSCSYQF